MWSDWLAEIVGCLLAHGQTSAVVAAKAMKAYVGVMGHDESSPFNAAGICDGTLKLLNHLLMPIPSTMSLISFLLVAAVWKSEIRRIRQSASSAWSRQY